MKSMTLVIGHGAVYVPIGSPIFYGGIYVKTREKDDRFNATYDFVPDIRCSAIPIKEWINCPYTSLDMDDRVVPDIVYRIHPGKAWDFDNGRLYDKIIDTTGAVFWVGDRYRAFFIDGVMSRLKSGGVFYGRKGFKLTKHSEKSARQAKMISDDEFMTNDRGQENV